MESYGLVLPQFIKFLTPADTNSDELRVPREIIRTYGNRLTPTLLFIFRNGYEIRVKFDAEEGTFYGLSDVYDDFELEGGEMLLFEFNGISGFNVYIIGQHLTEIEYPNVVHHMQKTQPRVVSLKNGGFKFVNFVKECNPIYDELEAPCTFKNASGLIPGYQRFVFSNGKNVVGGFNHDSGKFHGLHQFCSILGIEHFGKYNLILLSYETESVNSISVFDDNFVEVLFAGTPISPGMNSHNPAVAGRIELTVKPSHIYQYAYGVDIPTEFGEITSFWHRKDYIKVYTGEKSWKLQVMKRGCKGQRRGIKDGWMELRDDLGLAVGDVLVFEGADYCGEHFALQVLKDGGA